MLKMGFDAGIRERAECRNKARGRMRRRHGENKVTGLPDGRGKLTRQGPLRLRRDRPRWDMQDDTPITWSGALGKYGNTMTTAACWKLYMSFPRCPAELRDREWEEQTWTWQAFCSSRSWEFDSVSEAMTGLRRLHVVRGHGGAHGRRRYDNEVGV